MTAFEKNVNSFARICTFHHEPRWLGYELDKTVLWQEVSNMMTEAYVIWNEVVRQCLRHVGHSSHCLQRGKLLGFLK